MCHTFVNVKGEGVGFCDLKRTSVTIASGVDAVLVLALISEFDYYTRVGYPMAPRVRDLRAAD